MTTDLTNLTGNIRVGINAIATKLGDLSTTNENLAYSLSRTLAFGSTGTLVDNMFTDTRTLAANTSESLDLYGGIENKFGTTINFAKVKFVVIANKSTDTSCILNVTLDVDGSNISDGLYADGFYHVLAINDYYVTHSNLGWDVTAGTDELFTIENISDTDSATYDIIIIGTSA